jgi:biotin transporter BioY
MKKLLQKYLGWLHQWIFYALITPVLLAALTFLRKNSWKILQTQLPLWITIFLGLLLIFCCGILFLIYTRKTFSKIKLSKEQEIVLKFVAENRSKIIAVISNSVQIDFNVTVLYLNDLHKYGFVTYKYNRNTSYSEWSILPEGTRYLLNNNLIKSAQFGL